MQKSKTDAERMGLGEVIKYEVWTRATPGYAARCLGVFAILSAAEDRMSTWCGEADLVREITSRQLVVSRGTAESKGEEG